jgi:hypothetical protein
MRFLIVVAILYCILSWMISTNFMLFDIIVMFTIFALHIVAFVLFIIFVIWVIKNLF